MQTIVCPVHGEVPAVKDGIGRNSKQLYKCKECNRERKREKNESFKRMALEYKGGCCVVCGYDRCISALEFHHVIPSTKSNAGRSMTSHFHSWTKMKKELDKCILVCANCHREIHAGLHNEYAIAD